MIRVALLAALLCCFALTMAWAQQAAEKEYTLKLTEQQVGWVISVLTKTSLPYEQSAPILQSIGKQIQDQKQPPPPDDKK